MNEPDAPGDATASQPAWASSLRPTLRDVTIYDVPPAEAPIRLHANECAELWPPAVAERLGQVVRQIELSRYPDTSGRRLRAVLAERHGCTPDRIVLGNGSDEVIALLLTALGGPPQQTPVLVVPTPTFVMYAHTARVLGFEVREVPVDAELKLDTAAMERALQGATVCFIARPNNPTGVLWDAATIRRWVQRFPKVVFVVDEAYCDYAPGESLWGAEQPDNQVHMTTLSKVGMAALRVGYCIAHPVLCRALNKVRHPYNISATSLALATTVLTEFAEAQQAMVAATLEARASLAAMLRELPEATVFDSHANFVLVRLGPSDRAVGLRAFLAKRGILVKDVSKLPGLSGCLRVGAGTKSELARVHDALRAWTHGSLTP